MIIDSHCHLYFEDFDNDRDYCLQRCQTAGVKKCIVIGTCPETNQQAIALAEKYENVFATVGFHPCEITYAQERGEDPELWMKDLPALLSYPKVVALGECGLDYFHLPKEKDHAPFIGLQKKMFEAQLQLALEHKLNVVVHQRDAWNDSMEIIAPWKNKVRMVFHCFTETYERAMEVINQGHLVSFTGIVTFKKTNSVHDCAARVPLDSFMVETDAPYMAPEPHRGKRCEPAFTREITEKIASLRGVHSPEIAKATTTTAEKFFRNLTS
jgi:TatD DNase family protein